MKKLPSLPFAKPQVGLLLAILLVCGFVLAFGFSTSPARAASGEVVMLSTTNSGDGAGVLISKFNLAGKTVVLKTPDEWRAMTAADFDAYDAIVLGDPTCSSDVGLIQAAVDTVGVWAPVVDGNVVIIGADEAFHTFTPDTQGYKLMEKASAFVVADAAKTGAYISLSCYYHSASPGTSAPVLSGFGDFTVRGIGGEDAHIVATHPALEGLTDADLAYWYTSVHEGFDSWPIEFEVLAMIRYIGESYTAPDGTVGSPYILARGVQVISDIDLSPDTAENHVGQFHTVTAVVTTDDPSPGTPVVGTTITFSVIAGPHAGITGTDVTDDTGAASFSYTGVATGEDTIEATFVDGAGRTQRSNRVTKVWISGNLPPVVVNAYPSKSLLFPNLQMMAINVLGVNDPEGDPFTIAITGIRQDERCDTSRNGTYTPDGAGVGTSTAWVRAERINTAFERGNGRVYHIYFTATDVNDNAANGEVIVTVPLTTPIVAVDNGPNFNSTAATP